MVLCVNMRPMTADDVRDEKEARALLARDAIERMMRNAGMSSYRQLASAASKAGVDITSGPIADYLEGRRELSSKVQRAIAAAFDWPPNWPDHPPQIVDLPPERADEIAQILTVVQRLLEINEGLEARVDDMDRRLGALEAAADEFRRTLSPGPQPPRRHRPSPPRSPQPDACG